MALSHLLLFGSYYLCLSLLSWLGLHRAWLQLAARHTARPPHASPPKHWPPVLVQLPIYNEPSVAARVLHHAAAMRNVTRIQVLDDSTDETTALLEEAITRLRDSYPQLAIDHIRRGSRAGFKAGALAHGLKLSDEPFVVIFDADFCPPPDFVERTLPPLIGAPPKTGFVQVRWGHLNRERSLLTRAQATLLDGHFRREHRVRSARGLMFNFNGTAGIWRREAIESAGGWQHDTLTEDLDISWRAYLAGWRFLYLDVFSAPAELPETWASLRGQQSRWTRGSIQCLRKLSRRVLTAPLPLPVRLEAMVPLVANLAWPLVFLLMVFSFPVFVARQELGLQELVLLDLALLLPCTLSFFTFYFGVCRESGAGIPRALADAILSLLLGVGLSVNNSRAALLGMFGVSGTFVRTPKRGDANRPPSRSKFDILPLLELVLVAYLCVLLYLALLWKVHLGLPFILFFAIGLGVSSLRTFRR